jgi:ankyrin repeat protein
VRLIDRLEQLCYKVLGFSGPYVDYRESVISAKGKRAEGTCEWIQDHESYYAWLNGDIRLLWISGGPGKGKTMMSIFLTEHLEQKIRTMENTQLVYYFFSFQDKNRNTGVTLLQSLIYQMVAKRQQLRTHLLPYINFQQTEPSLEPLWAIFKKLIQDPELGTMLCVIDGLDESDKEATQILLPRLVDLLSPNLQSPLSTTFRLIVVSRDISGLEDCIRVKLDPDNNESVNRDIEEFISTRVCDLSRIFGSRHECEIEVRTNLLKRAEGTFLWVGFAMYELMQKKTWTEVFDALKTLPSGLPAIYSRMLHQIPAKHRKTGSRILQWVTMAPRPLKLLEIATAIGLEPSSSSISLEHAMMDEITLCGSFLKVQDSEVTLIHQSVRDYLLNEKQHNNQVLEAFRIKPNEAHFEMAQTCLQCIQQSILRHESLHMMEPPRLGESPLLRYAALHWLGHAASCSILAAELFGSTQSFFTQNRRLRDNWWRTYQGTTSKHWRFHDETPPLLHIACVLNIIPWVEMMIHKNHLTGNEDEKMLSRSFLDQRGMYGKTALHHAASTGNYLLVQLLVRSGADVSANSSGRTALHFAAASQKSNGRVIELLLKEGAEIEAPDHQGETALHLAIIMGNRQFIPILLEKGASLESVNLKRSTALHIAVERGDVDTVRLLLDKGADIQAKARERKTVLHLATYRQLSHRSNSGMSDMVQLLLDRGADIQAKDGQGETALHLATKYQFFGASQARMSNLVRILLDRGADIQARTFQGETVLHLAIIHHEFWGGSQFKISKVVQLLLKRGADKNARDNKGKTAFDDPRYINFLESLDETVKRLQKRSSRE